MKEILITTLVENALKEVKKFGYCDNSYKIFEYHYKNLLKYYEEKKLQNYSYDISACFLKEKHNIDITQGHFNYWQSRKCRAIKILDDVYNGKEIRIKYSYTKIKLNNRNTLLLNNYIDYNQKIGLSEKNIKGIYEFITRYLKYLENNNIEVEHMKSKIINQYLSSLTQINNITKRNYIFMLKMFFRYLYEQKIVNQNFEVLLPIIKKQKNSKIPSVWNFNELNQMIASIDRTTAKGKRDYAIIITAITTALRGGDIINLKFENVDFINNTITLVQEKTKNEIAIPLLDKTKEALLDYIKNARPSNNNYPNVFLNCRSTTKAIMDTSALSSMISKYSKKLNLSHEQKRGIHSLRHTTLNYLFNDNETSLTTITEISGHSNPDSLNAYIKTDIERLSELTLSINDFNGDYNE